MLDASPRNKDENSFFLRGKSLEAHQRKLMEIRRGRSPLRPINKKRKSNKSPSAGNMNTVLTMENYKLNLDNIYFSKRLKNIYLRENQYGMDYNNNDILSRRIKSYEILRQMEKQKLKDQNDAYKMRIGQTSGVIELYQSKTTRRKKPKKLNLEDSKVMKTSNSQQGKNRKTSAQSANQGEENNEENKQAPEENQEQPAENQEYQEQPQE